VGGVDVGVAEPRRLNPDADLARLERKPRHLLDDERLGEVVDDRCPVHGHLGLGRRLPRLGCWHDEPPCRSDVTIVRAQLELGIGEPPRVANGKRRIASRFAVSSGAECPGGRPEISNRAP
jgi:hypothetical protein